MVSQVLPQTARRAEGEGDDEALEIFRQQIAYARRQPEGGTELRELKVLRERLVADLTAARVGAVGPVASEDLPTVRK